MSPWWWLGIFVAAVIVCYELVGAGGRRLLDHVDQPKKDETAPDPGAPGGTS